MEAVECRLYLLFIGWCVRLEGSWQLPGASGWLLVVGWGADCRVFFGCLKIVQKIKDYIKLIYNGICLSHTEIHTRIEHHSILHLELSLEGPRGTYFLQVVHLQNLCNCIGIWSKSKQTVILSCFVFFLLCYVNIFFVN